MPENTNPVSTEQSQLETAMKQLSCAVADIENELPQLIARIGPLCTGEMTPGGGVEKGREEHSPLVNSIYDLTHRLRVHSGLICNTLGRLEC